MRALAKIMAVLTAATVALATLTVLTVVTAGSAGAARAVDSYERQAHQTTNSQRARRDLVRLKQNRCLQRFANRQARRMARKQRMYHQDLGPVLRRCDLRMAGENVAYGYRSGRTVVNRGWMRSPGHRQNILRQQFRLEAIGARRGDDGRWYTAQVFGRR